MNQITFNLIFGTLLRSACLLLAGWLGTNGLLPSGDTDEWAGAVALALLTVLWSLYRKYTERRKLVTALAMPATSEAVVVATIKDGLGATFTEVVK